MNNKGLKIGVDFDGVIADDLEVQIKYIKDMYGVTLSPKDLSEEARAKAIGKAASKDVADQFGIKGTFTMQLSPMKYCKEVLTRLISEGHKIVILTARYPEAAKKCAAFLNMHQIPYNHLTTSKLVREETIQKRGFVEKGYAKIRESSGKLVAEKSAVIEGLSLEVLIDDTPKHIINSQKVWKHGVPVNLFLFDRPYNQGITLEGVQRVYGWKDFYVKVREIVERKEVA